MRKDPPTIDESKQNKMRKDGALEDMRAQQDLHDVLTLPQGRRVMYRVLEMAGVGVFNAPVEVLGSHLTDTHATFEMLGWRNLGTQLKHDWMQLEPNLFRKMMDEATARMGEDVIRSRAEQAKTPEPEEEDES